MNLFFTCPVAGRLFSTAAYTMIENHGVYDDGLGGKVLKGRVATTQPCPHCGAQHIFRVDEVICPSGIDNEC